jgi:glycosyltransferase involved in cell wall biosynthesis
MRILYCNKYNYRFSGTEQYLFDLMDGMREHGHDVALFSSADLADAAANGSGHPASASGKFASFLTQARQAGRAIYSWRARKSLRRVIAEFRPQLAHVRNIYHHLSPSVFWELKAHRIPVIYHLNDFKLLCPNYNFVANNKICERCHGDRFWNVVTQGCYHGGRAAATVLATEAFLHKWLNTYGNCVDVFLAPSQFVKSKLEQFGWGSQRIEVLPHFQRIPDSVSPSSAGHGVLYFGRLSAEKGLHDLLSAMHSVPTIDLTIAGDGSQRGELEQRVRAERLDNVRFVGHLQGHELQRLIENCRFTIFPSRAYETLGKSILESYAHARTVIASDLGSRREFVRHHETGLLYASGNAAQLAGAISFLHSNPELADAMASAGRSLLRTQHSFESHYARLHELYRELIEAGKGRPRVAFIGGRGIGSKYSGIETFYEQAGERLVNRGCEVTAYCRKHFTPAIETCKGIKIVRLPSIQSKHLDSFTHTLLSTAHAMASDCDIVHYQCLGPALFSFLPRLFGKKTVVTVQGLDWQRKKWGWFAARILRLGEYASAKFPNTTVVVSHVLQNHYESVYGRRPMFIPNGTALRYPKDSHMLGEWNLQPNRYLLYMGRLSPEKNCEMLIDAYNRLGSSIPLVLAGGSTRDDNYVRKLRAKASHSVRFLGWVSGPALDELLTHAMLFVLPSDLEGLSLALLDAMAAARCVLASDIPENREAMGTAGFTFEAGNSMDLTRMLATLLHDHDARLQAGTLARQRARELYMWDDVVEKLHRLYLSLASIGSAELQDEPHRRSSAA